MITTQQLTPEDYEKIYKIRCILQSWGLRADDLPVETYLAYGIYEVDKNYSIEVWGCPKAEWLDLRKHDDQDIEIVCWVRLSGSTAIRKKKCWKTVFCGSRLLMPPCWQPEKNHAN